MKKMTMAAMSMTFAMLTLAVAAQASTFDTVMEHYEPVRIALMGDSMDSVNEHGAAMAVALRALKSDFSALQAGVSGDTAPVVQSKLDDMIAAADELARAASLQAARDAFYQLSMPLVRWHSGVDQSARPAVAYCPMHKKSWLQPDGEIGNPYGNMPRCGEIVSK